MAGTKEGGKKAAMKNLAKDPNFYAKIGAKGGRLGRTGGFAANPELARLAGAKGGRISRRRKAVTVASVTPIVAAADENSEETIAIAA
jgi:general stress protein YciG